MTHPRFLPMATILIVAAVPAAACHHSKPAPATFPALEQAARSRLVALSDGEIAGDPAKAASLTTGEAAVQADATARATAGEIAAGAPTPFGFDVVSVDAHPLDGGATDFVAFEKVRSRASGSYSNLVELYHRDGPTSPWRAAYAAWLEDNIDPPVLALNGNGNGHLVADDPGAMAMRYAVAVTVVSPTGQLPAGSFEPGAYTLGEVVSASEAISAQLPHGHRSRQWATRPGGATVALRAGTLVFATLQETETVHFDVVGTSHYFLIQDPKRVSMGGLLAPGNYSDVRETKSVIIAVVVAPGRLPDVVGRSVVATSTDGQLAPI